VTPSSRLKNTQSRNPKKQAADLHSYCCGKFKSTSLKKAILQTNWRWRDNTKINLAERTLMELGQI
jgi:hypothetical protein